MMILDEMYISQLSTVIRVNRQFFNLGIPRLWQAQRDIYLAKVPKDRRWVYTPLIQELDLAGSPKDVYEEFKDLVVHNVKELWVTLEYDLETIADSVSNILHQSWSSTAGLGGEHFCRLPSCRANPMP
jgi:hypothetical protein